MGSGRTAKSLNLRDTSVGETHNQADAHAFQQTCCKVSKKSIVTTLFSPPLSVCAFILSTGLSLWNDTYKISDMLIYMTDTSQYFELQPSLREINVGAATGCNARELYSAHLQ